LADDENRDWAEDPGWRLDWRAMTPYLQLHPMMRMRTRGEQLMILRSFFVSFLISLGFFGLLILQTLPFGGSTRATWAVGLFAIAVACGIVQRAFARRVPRCDSDRELSDWYRSQAFGRIAAAFSTPLFAFCAALQTNTGWLFFAGVLFAIPLFISAAPTREALVREQERLDAAGCDRSLVAALRRPRSG
jgi:hypothetical protein